MTRFLEPVFVWLGGAVFVTSLALTGWAYALWFGQPAPAAGWRPVVFNVALLTVFALHHSIFARPWMKRKLARVFPERLLRSAYVWVASLLLIAVCLAWKPIGGDLYEAPRAWIGVVHAMAQLTGVWLIARSVRAIDALELAGIRPARPASAGDTLQISGPYRLVRHPLYLGWILIVFGAAHLTGDRAAFAAITTMYLLVAIPWEERSLEHTFGAEYARYKKRVPWRVVPYLY
jgi:protein-S-isoprenylcysteine O-methyltransferase Ste14